MYFTIVIKKDITNRIIAMGFPAVCIESIYRNTMSEVERQYLLYFTRF